MTLFEEDKKMEDEMYDNDGEPASETDFDYKDIDTMETALLVGAERIQYLPEPFEEETSEKLTEIADWGLLLTKFVIEQARYTRYLLIREAQETDRAKTNTN